MISGKSTLELRARQEGRRDHECGWGQKTGQKRIIFQISKCSRSYLKIGLPLSTGKNASDPDLQHYQCIRFYKRNYFLGQRSIDPIPTSCSWNACNLYTQERSCAIRNVGSMAKKACRTTERKALRTTELQETLCACPGTCFVGDSSSCSPDEVLFCFALWKNMKKHLQNHGYFRKRQRAFDPANRRHSFASSGHLSCRWSFYLFIYLFDLHRPVARERLL